MSSKYIGPSRKYSVAPSEKKTRVDLYDIEAPKDPVLKIMATEQGFYA